MDFIRLRFAFLSILGLGLSACSTNAIVPNRQIQSLESVSSDKLRGAMMRFHELYGPLAEELDGTFSVNVSETETAAAHAERDGSHYRIVVDRGLLDSSRASSDAVIMAICHEAGHLFGGAPMQTPPPEWDGPLGEDGMTLYSAEGQADYYATRVCFKRAVEGEDHLAALRGQAIPRRVARDCDAVWEKGSEDARLCMRSALASLDFLTITADFPLSLEARDLETVSVTNQSTYPSRQCRLDTLVAGALCGAADPLDLRGGAGASSGCEVGFGARPSCWFK